MSSKRFEGRLVPPGTSGVDWPPWPKYGPIARITGVLSVSLSPLGRNTSTCSVGWPGVGMYASFQSAPGGTSAEAVAGIASAASAAIMSRRKDLGITAPNDRKVENWRRRDRSARFWHDHRR